jgi:hypothetical protein
MRVLRATYRNPNPTANRRTVKITREVRVSMSAMVVAGPFQCGLTHGPSATLITHDFCVIAGDKNFLQLELVVEPHRPVAAFAAQDELVEFAF